MFRTDADLKKYAILGTDSSIPIGHVADLYFDDESWVVRYLVVETGGWLSSRKVLIATEAITHADWAQKVVRVAITQAQVRGSPDIDTQKPVCRQHERDYLGYYGYPFYWERAGLWGCGPFPELEGRGDAVLPRDALALPVCGGDVHLRSAKEVKGYHIQATDGEIGYADGLLIDEKSGAIRFVFVNTNGWWLDHTVLVAPEWIDRVSWKDLAFYVDLTREQVRGAPSYNGSHELTRKQEIGLYGHYRRHGYWTARVPAPLSEARHV